MKGLFRTENLPKEAFLLDFADKQMFANEKEKHRNDGFQYVFRDLKEAFGGCFLSHFEDGNPECRSLTDVVSHCDTAF